MGEDRGRAPLYMVAYINPLSLCLEHWDVSGCGASAKGCGFEHCKAGYFLLIKGLEEFL